MLQYPLATPAKSRKIPANIEEKLKENRYENRIKKLSLSEIKSSAQKFIDGLKFKVLNSPQQMLF